MSNSEMVEKAARRPYMTFTVQLPTASDAFGRWLETNGGHVEITCMMGSYTVTVAWNRLHRYDDARGSHREVWELTRSGKDLAGTFNAAMAAVLAESEVR